MKKVILIAVAVLGALTVSSCRKETEKFIERVEVQRGNQILSGMGAPSENLGNIGDYYLDLSNTNLYGAKTAQGWGTPISLKGIQGDKGDTGAKGDKGDTGAKGDKGDTGAKGDKGDTGAKGDKGDTGAKGDKGDAGAKGDAGTKGNGQNVGQKGDKGDKGDKGEQGVAGKDGTKIYAGVGAPTNIGKAGDWYIDTLNKRLYGPKLEGTWGTSYIELGSNSNTTPSKPISTDKYKLSGDGSTLLEWKYNGLKELDMNDYTDEEWKFVTHIGSSAFLGWRKLESFVFSPQITTIGISAFNGCESLRTITIPNSVVDIEEGAFYGCKSLTSITLPKYLKAIKTNTFQGCESLRTITIPSSVKRIEKAAFANCHSLTSITIPDGVKTIGENCFYFCSSLKTVIIPDSVKNIESESFSVCRALISITLPNNLKNIGTRAFEHCSSLETVIINSKVPPVIDNYSKIFEDTLKVIYVPAESVEIYKKAEGWSRFADKIKAKQ